MKEQREPREQEAEQRRAQAPARYVVVDAERAGQRIDNFLLARLNGAPRALIYRILRRGEVRVNRKRVKPPYRLRAGDAVRIPPLHEAPARPAAAPSRRASAWLDGALLYEDDDLLILDKPAGIAVHGGSGLSWGVIETLRACRPDGARLELVHRLDRATSGCLLVARRRSALRALHERLREGGVMKRYVALARGQLQPCRVDAPLRKNLLRSGERMVRIDAAGKPASSRFRPQRHYADASLVEVALLTGRTHQIRVHAAHIGHPLAGDEKYGDDPFNRRLRAFGLNRLFLHAAELRFPHPRDGRPMRISAPLPEALRRVLQRLDAQPRGTTDEHG